ncbi:hypothetical protein FOA43_002579 [Brettanomyces nanus]|uniref:Sphingoid long-chain base transporter RSB1 n=1 Tax=Eeniella nana TaxID=13502 RepID=A0A875S665_EENNA|nr:uncharacterized protein FOA43_002579 [Brettanomyces nanus]QPG75229.1 hypothetical protein FOA43_002579 [Brettanomyces nanus]
MAIIYFCLIVIHAVFGVLAGDRFFPISFIIGCVLEFIGYVGRSLGYKDPTKLSWYVVQSLGIAVAPILFMAGIYNTFGESIPVFGSKYSVLKPTKYRYIFIVSDVISFVVQCSGGGLSAYLASTDNGSDVGTNIMVAALAFQVFSMSVFMFLVLLFFYRVHKARKMKTYVVVEDPKYRYLEREYSAIRKPRYFRGYVYAYFIATILVYIRCVYRVAEMSTGFTGPTSQKEVWFLVFDLLMIILAVGIVTIFYPGAALAKGRLRKWMIPEEIDARLVLELEPEMEQEMEQEMESEMEPETKLKKEQFRIRPL